AVSAHTDCLIQIVKERRNSSLLREWNSTQPPSRVKPYFQRLFEVIDEVVCVAACPVDVAHYRDPAHIGKALPQLNCKKLHFFSYSYQHTAFIQTYPQICAKREVLPRIGTVASDAQRQRRPLYKEAYSAVLIPIQPL
ncbi:hypothetical protein, partial [Aeromonas sobria]